MSVDIYIAPYEHMFSHVFEWNIILVISSSSWFLASIYSPVVNPVCILLPINDKSVIYIAPGKFI